MQDSTITMVQLKTTKQTLFTAHSTTARNARKSKSKSTAAKRRVCKRCGGPIAAIGSWRANGAKHPDWWGRAYHKQCWKAFDRP